MGILDSIGNTPLVSLEAINPYPAGENPRET